MKLQVHSIHFNADQKLIDFVQIVYGFDQCGALSGER